MPVEVLRPSEVKPFSGDTFVIDTNVLIMQYASWLDHDARQVREYSAFLDAARARGARLVVVPEVLSEFVGVSTRQVLNRTRDGQLSGLSVKERLVQFRASEGWSDFCGDLEAQLRSITSLVEVIPSPVRENADVLEVFCTFRDATLDWTDVALLRAAQQCGGMIVAHDRDFVGLSGSSGVSIVSALRV